MTGGVRARSPDAELARRLQGWIDAMRLSPPGELWIEVDVAEQVTGPPEAPPLFRQPEIAIHADPSSGGVVVHWEAHPARAHVSSSRPVAHVTLSRSAVDAFDRCQRFFLTSVLIFLVRRAGWHHVHAATWVDPRGRGWLLAGDQHVGKSTTTALVARAGWVVGGDDVVFLTREGERVSAIARRAPIGLRPGGHALLRAPRGGRYDSERDKTFFMPEELGGSWQQVIRPEVLVFPAVGDGSTTSEPISGGTVLAELVRWSAWVALEPSFAQEHLDLLAALGRGARSYRMTLGTDLFDRPELLMELTT